MLPPLPVREPTVAKKQPELQPSLWLVSEDGRATWLAETPPSKGPVYSQQVFQMRPDKSAMAYVDASPRGPAAIRVRWTQGESWTVGHGDVEDMRFSPNGRWLAVATGDQVIVADLSARSLHTVGHVASPRWVEWSQGEVIALHQTESGGDAISRLSLSGTQQLLARPAKRVSRLVVAAAAPRLAWFTDAGAGGTSAIWGLSIDASGAEPERWGTAAGGRVLNAEMAPRGDELAFITGWGAFHMRAGELPEVLSDDEGAHSLWYAPDGGLAWATPHDVGFRRAGRIVRLPAPEAIRTMRLASGGDGVMFTTASAVWHWRAGEGRATVVTRPAALAPLRSSDAFGASAVVWAEGSAPAKKKVRAAAHPRGASSRSQAQMPLLATQ